MKAAEEKLKEIERQSKELKEMMNSKSKSFYWVLIAIFVVLYVALSLYFGFSL
jgi:hypothetical protein